MAIIDDIDDEFDGLNNSDKNFFARSWNAFKKWVKDVVPGIVSNAMWELIKIFWKGLGG